MFRFGWGRLGVEELGLVQLESALELGLAFRLGLVQPLVRVLLVLVRRLGLLVGLVLRACLQLVLGRAWVLGLVPE